MKLKKAQTADGRSLWMFQIKGFSYYVQRTSEKTWVITNSLRLTLDTMVSLGGEFHFPTLRSVKEALAKEGWGP